jgi:hypothetical protein
MERVSDVTNSSSFTRRELMRIALTTAGIFGVSVFALGCAADRAVDPSVLNGGPLAAVASGSQPASPSNASAVSPSQGRIDISWHDNSGNETGFEVHRSTTGPSGSFTLVATTGRDAVAHSESGLSAATPYCYRIRAARASGKRISYSSFSNVACATTPEPPASPYTVSARPVNSSTIQVSVARVNISNAPAYRRYRSTDGGATWELVASPANAGAFWFLDDGRASEQSVCYRVVAYDAVADAVPSNTACTSPPAAPTNLTATAVNADTIELTWHDNSAVEDGYEVWLYYEYFYCPCGEIGGCNSGSEMGESVVADLPANSTTRRVPALATACNVNTFYYVRAKKDGGTSDASNALDAVGPVVASPIRRRSDVQRGSPFSGLNAGVTMSPSMNDARSSYPRSSH